MMGVWKFPPGLAFGSSTQKKCPEYGGRFVLDMKLEQPFIEKP
jgi:hypothetical protein